MPSYNEQQTSYGARTNSPAAIRSDASNAPFITDLATGAVNLVSTGIAIRAVSGMAVIEVAEVVAATQVNIGFYVGNSIVGATLLWYLGVLVAPVSAEPALYTTTFKFTAPELEEIKTSTRLWLALSSGFDTYAVPAAPITAFQAVGTFRSQPIPALP